MERFFLMAPLGATSAHKLPVETLKLGFAAFMAVVAINMWMEILG